MQILLVVCMLVGIMVGAKADSVSLVNCVLSAFFVVCKSSSFFVVCSHVVS